MAPEDVQYPNSQDVGVYFMWQKGIKATGAIKFASHLTLKGCDLDGPSVIIRTLIRRGELEMVS